MPPEGGRPPAAGQGLDRPSPDRSDTSDTKEETTNREVLSAGECAPMPGTSLLQPWSAWTRWQSGAFPIYTNLWRIRRYGEVNGRMGYPTIEIRSPKEVENEECNGREAI